MMQPQFVFASPNFIGVGDRGAGGAIALPIVKFGSVESKIRATQNIFRAVVDSLKIFFIF